MTQEQKMVSQELAKKLKDAGMPQDRSEQIWMAWNDPRFTKFRLYPAREYQVRWQKDGIGVHETRWVGPRGSDSSNKDYHKYPAAAPNCDELLEMLPTEIKSNDDVNHDLYMRTRYKVFNAYYWGGWPWILPGLNRECEGKNLAEALGQLLLWCLEKGHVKREKR